MNDILSSLNPSQQEAVLQTEGPVMVLAGAGSGKTKVLTHRIAHLLNNNIEAYNILSLTFTNKAAREMKDRIIKLIGSQEGMNVWMGTFHSIFARILRIEAEQLGYPRNFSIYDSEDSKKLIKDIIKENNLNDKVYAPGYVMSRISGAKANLISAREYLNNSEIVSQDDASGKPLIGKLYNIYAQKCFKAAAMDFDDLLFNMNVLLRDFPDTLLKYQKKFKYILVDEYQDTNFAQYLIVKQLAADNENVCVVGDDAQSIYSFRGANIENIFNFKKDYPDAMTIKLEQNYRSSKVIVNAANSIISKNKKQFFKEIWTDNAEGEKIKVIKALTDNEEGRLVADSIFNRKQNNQLNNDSFAILYRTNAQSRSFEEAMRRLNIPYKIFGGLSFYKRKEIKDLLAYFQLAANNKNEAALLRVINYPQRGIGTTSIEKIIIAANEQQTSFWEVASRIKEFDMGINQGTVTKIDNFITMIKSFSARLHTKIAYELAQEIGKECGLLQELYNDKTPEGLGRFENIEELLNAIKDFSEIEITEDGEIGENVKTLDAFMQDIALLTDADEDEKDNSPKVSLMTIHAAKGLEFPYIFLVGVEENLFPSMQSLGSREDLEEERRLFYVGVTRAKEQVTISYAEQRYKWGNLISCEPSRFIDEIDAQYLDMPKAKTFHRNFLSEKELPSKEKSSTTPSAPKPDTSKLKKVSALSNTVATGALSSAEINGLQTGMQVEHERFGIGKVISIEGNEADKKATVFFQGTGNKQLLLKFAKLKILS